ncbi:MAG: Spy/CpxP family protein refolding chaperone [Gammaproteobacteria bacterium]|nr:Spy/CpxP family protein refolding chaperone [Gammaproteobacteria bacterium]
MTGNRKNWIKSAIVTVALLGVGGLGVAAAKSGGTNHGHCGAKHGGHMAGKSWLMPGRHVEGKLAFLKTELKIADDQEEAWEAFAAVVRETETARAGMREAHRERRGSMRNRERPALDERIDRGLAAMEQRFEIFRNLAAATKALYGDLTPEQQDIADKLLPHGGGHGRHFRF